MAFKKQANAVVAEPALRIGDWEKLYGARAFTVKTGGIKKVASNATRYLLSHCTIMSSVMTEADPFDHLIKPECSHLVNNNDDGWENTVLKLSYRSFVGAFNFVEHFQNSKNAKGHLLDALARKVHIAPEVWVYFVDILVATDMAHEQLVNKIRSGEIRYLSMGCVTDLVICSFCGQRVTDNGSYCPHLAFQKGMFLPDDDGIPRRIAELCGHKSLANGGVKFVEASWVATPAFPGAAMRNIVAEEWLGPKSPYTKAASREGMQKAASARYPNVADALLRAELHKKLR